MNELVEALLPFFNPFPEMPGGSSTPPGPFGTGGTDILNAPNEENERRELVGVVREPLIADSVRREELERLSYSRIEFGVETEFSDDRVNLQFELEKRLEYALREEGFSENSIAETRHEWRREALTSTSRDKFVSIGTLKRSLAITKIRDSAAYRKIMRASSYNHTHGHIHLRKEGFGPPPAAQ